MHFIFVFQVILNAKIFLGLRRVQTNLKRHKTLSSESKKSRPAAFLAAKCGLSKGEGKKNVDESFLSQSKTKKILNLIFILLKCFTAMLHRPDFVNPKTRCCGMFDSKNSANY